MNFASRILRDTFTAPLLDKVGEYIEQNGLTQRAIEKTKQVSELVSSTWRPAIAHSIRKGVVFCLGFTAFIVLYCLVGLSFSAEWVNFGEGSALKELLGYWKSVLDAFFQYALYFLGIYAGLREAGKGRDSILSKAARKLTQRKVVRVPMDTDLKEEIEPIPGVKKRRRRMSPEIDNEEVSRKPFIRSIEKALNKGYEWGHRSIERMLGVDDDIVHLLTVALEKYSEFDVGIADKGGLRLFATQLKLFQDGISPTLNSRHLHGYALDIICYDENGVYTDQWKYYALFEEAVRKASIETGIPYEWGGRWESKDGVHFQLPKSQYPDKVVASL